MNISIKNKLFYIAFILIFLFGVFLRIKGFLYNKSFWYDEAALALNIMDRSFAGFLQPLDYVQCAPFLFLVFAKMATIISGTSEYAFRFIPLLAGCLSIFAFYFLAKKILIKKYSIFIAVYLFCVNYNLVYYSSEFKQYSSEILITILLILHLAHQDIKTLNLKKSFMLGILFFISFLFSMPSGIIMAAFIIYIIYKKKELSTLKTIFAICLPFITLFIPYYFTYLLPSKAIMMEEYWQNIDIYINFKSLYFIIRRYFYFAFYPNYNPFCPIVLLSCGAFLFFKEKKKIEALFLLILFTAFLTSVFKIYPIFDRMASYLIPLLIIVAIKPIDYTTFKISEKKIVFSIFIIFITLLYFRMNTFKYIARFYNKDVFYKGSARELILSSAKNVSKNDIFIIPKWTFPAYEYYSRRYFKETPEVIYPKNKNENIKGIFDSLPAGKICWFYIPWKADNLNEIKTTTKNTKILFQKEIIDTKNTDKNAYIIKVEKL